ncbi:hypothetical protein AAFC00_001073 [Neodothiora populina]|uniref:MOSC domain-containing protein n=1 Tax=Neodothiora populina TaxID=2781224 RepID=A0ABR3PN32_9PEZI
MKVTRIFIYPIKSLRAYEPASAELTKHGFPHDRIFMILHRQPDGSLKNMHVAHYPDLVLFFPTIDYDSSTITVTYRPPMNTNASEKSMNIPLQPDVTSLQQIDVEMHKSPTKAFDMGAKYNDWLSRCLGYDVVLAYLGPNLRPILMSTPNNPGGQKVGNSSSGWLSSITSKLPTSISGLVGATEEKITFADCAPYLIVSEKSMDDVSNRLPQGEEMDITKFRPNIIVSGAEKPWEEDMWAEMQIGESKAKIHCKHNCARCQSINIDYATGKPGTGESGKILKMLQKDRRIDKGMKYSPVFGRYSFADATSEGVKVAVGDEVVITKRNNEQTVFDWTGMATT